MNVTELMKLIGETDEANIVEAMGTRNSGSTGVNEPENGDPDATSLGNKPTKQ